MTITDATSGTRIWGRDLRWLLTTHLIERGPLTTSRLVELVEAEGFVVDGLPSKAVADAIRCEVARGRVARTGRGRYEFAGTSRSTAWRIRNRIRTLRNQATPKPLSL